MVIRAIASFIYQGRGVKGLDMLAAHKVLEDLLLLCGVGSVVMLLRGWHCGRGREGLSYNSCFCDCK